MNTVQLPQTTAQQNTRTDWKTR